MAKNNVLVAASLLLLATACKENNPVVPARGFIEVSSQEPVLLIPLNDSVYVHTGISKPVKANQGVPGSAYHLGVMPEEVFGDK